MFPHRLGNWSREGEDQDPEAFRWEVLVGAHVSWETQPTFSSCLLTPHPMVHQPGWAAQAQKPGMGTSTWLHTSLGFPAGKPGAQSQAAGQLQGARWLRLLLGEDSQDSMGPWPHGAEWLVQPGCLWGPLEGETAVPPRRNRMQTQALGSLVCAGFMWLHAQWGGGGLRVARGTWRGCRPW